MPEIVRLEILQVSSLYRAQARIFFVAHLPHVRDPDPRTHELFGLCSGERPVFLVLTSDSVFDDVFFLRKKEQPKDLWQRI